MIAEFLKNKEGTVWRELEYSKIPDFIADLIMGGKVVGWFQGRMEFGPRALGSRSIVGDARSSEMQKIMNLKIKFRESFRPFAPSVLVERMQDYFEIDRPSPYMLFTAAVRKERRKIILKKETRDILEQVNMIRSDIPAVTHIDYSARIQSVNRDLNPLYYDMIAALEKKCGYAVVINTSFNVRGEPIVCTPEDAYLCFMRTNIDFLLMGKYLLVKKDQHSTEVDSSWQKEYELD